MNNRVVEHVAKTMKAGGKKGSILSAQNSVADNAESEMNSKGRAADMEADSRGNSLRGACNVHELLMPLEVVVCISSA